MTDKDILQHLQSILKIGNIYGPYSNRRNKPIYRWDVNIQKDAAGLMMTLYPLMGRRRQIKIRDCIATWKLNTGEKRTRGQSYWNRLCGY